MKKGSLVVIGSGIKFQSHLTVEAISYIRQSDKVLFSINEPAMQVWIKRNNKNAESLDLFENNYDKRMDAYRNITHIILENVKKNKHVCVVFYGHPTVFAKSALDAAIISKQKGYFTKVMPGISADNCLFADLMIDPGSHGCQSYETTDFLIRRRHVDTTVHLILWQVGIIGAFGFIKNYNNTKGIKLLFDYLSQYYPLDHVLVLYEAALYPHLEPTINNFPLKDIIQKKFSPISTLYIPPTNKAEVDTAILQKLTIA